DHDSSEIQHFSRFLMCETSGISYNEPEPNLFSFNSPYGACRSCSGLGFVSEIDSDKIIPDRKKSIKAGGIEPLKDVKNPWFMENLGLLLESQDFSLKTPIEDLPDDLINEILYGLPQTISFKDKKGKERNVKYEGLVNFISRHYSENSTAAYKRWVQTFMNHKICPSCEGARLKKEARYFRISDKAIYELAQMDIGELTSWFADIENK